MIKDEWLESERRYWLDNFKRVRDDKMELKEENERLKQELFNLYLKHYN